MSPRRRHLGQNIAFEDNRGWTSGYDKNDLLARKLGLMMRHCMYEYGDEKFQCLWLNCYFMMMVFPDMEEVKYIGHNHGDMMLGTSGNADPCGAFPRGIAPPRPFPKVLCIFETLSYIIHAPVVIRFKMRSIKVFGCLRYGTQLTRRQMSGVPDIALASHRG